MYKNLSPKYYQENKEKLKKKAFKRYQNLSNEEKKSQNMVLNVTKLFQKMKKINWWSIEKYITE